MPYRTTKFTNNQLYHAYNRGFCKETIFENYADRQYFRKKMNYYAGKFKISIESDSVTVNHYHFILRQFREKGVREFLTRVQLSYAMYYNGKYERRGQVFEGRYNAIPINDMRYRYNIYNYVFHNPLKHRREKE